MTIEYRVKPVTRYIVTRHEDTGHTGSNRQIGNEYDNADVAYEVGYALARQDAERLGLPPGDMGVIYPQDPRFANAIAGGGVDEFPQSGLSGSRLGNAA